MNKKDCKCGHHRIDHQRDGRGCLKKHAFLTAEMCVCAIYVPFDHVEYYPEPLSPWALAKSFFGWA